MLRSNLEYLHLETSEIRAMGGGATSPLWCQIKSDMTGKKLVTLKNKETACLGGAILAGVGTGGTIMGIAKRLRQENPTCRAFPLEPSNSPTLSTGYKVGQHRIYGISDEFIPDILKLSQMNEIVSVDDGDAICMARLLSETLGIGVGVSSGANFLGCVLAQEILGDDAVIVTVFADDNKKYLSTDYAKPQGCGENALTADIQLSGVSVIR